MENSFPIPASRICKHHGHNIKRLRRASNIKQEAMALDLDISQQSMSRIEGQKEVDGKLLQKISAILKVPVDVIKEMEDDPANTIIENNFDNSLQPENYSANKLNTNSSVDKIMEMYERLLNKNEYEFQKLRKEILELKKIVSGLGFI